MTYILETASPLSLRPDSIKLSKKKPREAGHFFAQGGVNG